MKTSKENDYEKLLEDKVKDKEEEKTVQKEQSSEDEEF